MYQKIETIAQALKAAKEAEREDLNGLYPMALRVLAKHVEDECDKAYAKREYIICYVENGKKHHCGQADTIEEAEKLRLERQEVFAPLEVLILEKETVCREIRYT